MTLTGLAFVDIETTGLDPDQHEILEVAVIRPDLERQLHFSLAINEEAASDDALRINGYYDRPQELSELLIDPEQAAVTLEKALERRAFVGVNPAFDAAFIRRFLLTWERKPTWHYQIIDVKAMAAGALKAEPPWKTESLAEGLGLTMPEGRHTAYGDALLAEEFYNALLG